MDPSIDVKWRSFLRHADKTQLHFHDEERLNQVIIAFHLLEPPDYRALKADFANGGFDEAGSAEVAIQIQQGLELLDAYDQTELDGQ
jgi:hypothetical protein